MLFCLRMGFKGDKVFPQEFSIYVFIFVLACDALFFETEFLTEPRID